MQLPQRLLQSDDLSGTCSTAVAVTDCRLSVDSLSRISSSEKVQLVEEEELSSSMKVLAEEDYPSHSMNSIA